MTPSPNRQAVVVGLFVASALAILAGGILTIGDLNDTFTHKVTVSTVFEEVNGLKKGDNIWFSGVKVGIVKQVSFHDGAQVQVEMKIDADATRYIHQDALAKISSDGLIGSKLVVLYGGTSTAPGLADGDVLQSTKAISTDEIMATLQANNTNLLAITTDFRGISAGLAKGEGTLGALLKDDSLYTDVKGTVATLDAASSNARTLTGSLSTFANKMNKEGSLPNELVTDRTTYASLTATVDELHAAGARASTLMDGLADGAADPHTPIGALAHDTEAGSDLRGTLDNLNRGSGLLNEDLEAMQHNFLLRGFFKKREKAAAKAKALADEDAAESGAPQVPVSER